jgi:ABC-2 type transport system permease protein/oleandomycin transport system permease protein
MIGITLRYLMRFARTPQLLFFGTVQPVLFLVGLSAVFGGLVEGRLGGHYIQYLLPGVLTMNTILFAGTTGVGLAEDLQAGIIDRFRSLPMAQSGVLVGRTVADLARNAASMALIVLVGFAMGFRLHASIAAGLVALFVALLFGYATSWVFAAVGLAVKDAQTAQFIGFAPVLPLVYLSGAWIPVAAMAGGVRAFARNQPVNVAVEAVRTLEEGTRAYHWVWQSLLWSGGLLAVFGVLAVRLYRRAAS